MENKRLRIVQIGTAHDHAADIIDTMRALPDEYEILGVHEPDPDKRKAAMLRKSYDGRRYSYEGVRWLSLQEVDSLEHLDAIIIESEESKLVGYAQHFAEKGIPIHIDKPCGEDYPAFKKLIEVVRSKNLPFHVGYMYRYNAGVAYCQRLINTGKLGEIFSVEAQISVLHNKEKRAWLSKFKGGMMFFLGCHLIDLVYLFCGEPEEVIPYNTSTHNDSIESEDNAFAIFRYKNGISFVKSCASEVNGFDRRQLVVCGTKGTVVLKPIELRTGGENVEQLTPAHVTFYEDGIANQFGKAGEDVQFGPFGRYLEMMIDFAEIVRGKRNNAFSYEHELAVQRLVLQACGNFKEEL